jgi:copper(I)-binding protein
MTRKLLIPLFLMAFLPQIAFSGTKSVVMEASILNQNGIAISNFYARPSMGAQNTAAAYFNLHNTTGNDIKLLRITSGLSDNVELHDHVNQGGIMRMVKIDSIPLASGAQVALKPGSLHVMIMNPKKEVKAGTLLPLELHFSNGEKFTAHFPVKAF